MNDLTLEALAKRIEVLEHLLGVRPTETTSMDWRDTVCMPESDEFIECIFVEGRAIREAERQAARDEQLP